MQELPQERLIVGNMAIASAEACFEWTRSYVKDRKVSKGVVMFIGFLLCSVCVFIASIESFMVGCRGLQS